LLHFLTLVCLIPGSASNKTCVCRPAAIARKCFTRSSAGEFALSIRGRGSAARLLAKVHRAKSSATAFSAGRLAGEMALMAMSLLLLKGWAPRGSRFASQFQN
jgi:hypothetical protein